MQHSAEILTVQESQIFQVCYNVEYFLQESDNIFAKFAFICKKLCYFDQKLVQDFLDTDFVSFLKTSKLEGVHL